jgi:hypothetical protein
MMHVIQKSKKGGGGALTSSEELQVLFKLERKTPPLAEEGREGGLINQQLSLHILDKQEVRLPQ